MAKADRYWLLAQEVLRTKADGILTADLVKEVCDRAEARRAEERRMSSTDWSEEIEMEEKMNTCAFV